MFIPLAFTGIIYLAYKAWDVNKVSQSKFDFSGSVDTLLNSFSVGPMIPGGSSTEVILARTLYGEARNEGETGMTSVANVIVNRARAKKLMWGLTISAVCLKRAQFSAWNPYHRLSLGDKNIVANYNRMISVTPADPQFVQALAIARAAVAGTLKDNTGGATYYHTTAIKPRWAAGVVPIKVVGSHAFYTTAQIG